MLSEVFCLWVNKRLSATLKRCLIQAEKDVRRAKIQTKICHWHVGHYGRKLLFQQEEKQKDFKFQNKESSWSNSMLK